MAATRLSTLEKIEWALDTIRNKYNFGLPDVDAGISRERRAKGVLLDCKIEIIRLKRENAKFRKALERIAEETTASFKDHNEQ